MIRFDRVSARYPRGDRDVLDGVSLSVPRGAITGVVGPNGSGKTTVVRAILGRVAVTGGRVMVNDRPLSELSPRDLARTVAVVAQREELLFPMTVRDYIALGRFPHLGAFSTPGASDRVAVDRAVERADVERFLDRRTDTLSGGEWQRVRIARALAQGGGALVLDEPTAFLDIAHEMSLFELLASLAAGGQAVMVVSHHLNLVARFVDSIVLLHGGRVAAAGPPEDVLRLPVLEEVYEWPLAVIRDPVSGSPYLVPLRSTPESPAGADTSNPKTQ